MVDVRDVANIVSIVHLSMSVKSVLMVSRLGLLLQDLWPAMEFAVMEGALTTKNVMTIILITMMGVALVARLSLVGHAQQEIQSPEATVLKLLLQGRLLK